MVKGNVYAGTDSITLRKIVRHGRANGVPARNVQRAYGALVERRTSRLARLAARARRADISWERGAPGRKAYCEAQARIREAQRAERLRRQERLLDAGAEAIHGSL